MSNPSQSVRTVFILDVSGSMQGLKSETLQLSVKRYIEDISKNSYVGIVSFKEKASIKHKVVKITDRKIRDSLIGKVPKKSEGGTDIGKGLLMGLNSLKKAKLNTEGANFILVTDGEDTSKTHYVNQVLPHLLNAKIKIICIALGNTADPNLERLANETNGKVFIASDSKREMAIRVFESAFIESKTSTELNEAVIISVCNDLIQVNQSVVKKVTIDSDIGRNTHFSICSEDMNKFSISIISPNKQQFDLTSSEFKIDESYKRYQLSLKRADSGVWSIHFKKLTNEKLSVTVSVTSQPLNPNAIKLSVWLKDANSLSKMPPIIFAVIRKGDDDVMGAEVVATIDKPDGTQSDVVLNNYNNIYSNYFTDYCGSGRYNVSVLAKNNSNNCQLKSNQTRRSSSRIESVPHFERQLIVGCFKVTDFMPSAPSSSQKLKELSNSESIKSTSSYEINNTVETPAPRNTKAPTATAKTSWPKKNDEQLNEIETAKDKLRENLLVVKKLVTFSKLTYVEKDTHKKIIEEIDSFIYSSKPTTMQEVDGNRIKLEKLMSIFSNK